jgi:acetylornithine deacetylase/succinyl-diaminopimelate desuccinylase-like protein
MTDPRSVPATIVSGESTNRTALFDYIDSHFPDFLEKLIQICEVPAPTFLEQDRGSLFASLFREMDPRIDEVGNVIVPYLKNGPPHVVLSAHLDTVFPFREIKVERSGSVFRAPGISDDSAGLACLYFLYQAFESAGCGNQGSLTLLATVGEEGLGNLRGARHFFNTTRIPVDYFISLDGCDAERLVTVGLASKRLRMTLRGPGGHSWGDAGLPNPIQIAGEFLSSLNKLILPQNPKTTLNVGMIHGGTSVNTIPTDVSMEIDLRSESMENLLSLDQWVQKKWIDTLEASSGIDSEIVIVGERPAGKIDPDHVLVQKAISANLKFGLDAKLETGSTDSNIPFSLGIPAITMGVGGNSGKIHTPEEWYDVKGAETGIKRTAQLITELFNL